MTFAFRSLPRQRGNTLTGVIIGLIVGLVIAVAVALLITKGATPFTDKSGKAGKMGDPSPDQIADPNKPMYGNKEAARQANKEVAAKTRQDDPLGDAVKAMDAAPAAAPVAGAAAPDAAAKPPLAEVKPAADPAKVADASNVAPKPVAPVSATANNRFRIKRMMGLCGYFWFLTIATSIPLSISLARALFIDSTCGNGPTRTRCSTPLSLGFSLIDASKPSRASLARVFSASSISRKAPACR